MNILKSPHSFGNLTLWIYDLQIYTLTALFVFAVKQIFSLMELYLFIFVVGVFQEIIIKSNVIKDFLSHFTVSSLIVKFWIQFELCFFFHLFCKWISNLPRTICSRNYSIPMCILCILIKDQLSLDLQIYFWILHSVPLFYISVSMPVPYCFNYWRLVIYFKIRKCDGCSSFYSFQLLIYLLWAFVFVSEL